ncbi:MAG: protein phosphatase [Pirellulaceae bacterium]|nr:MAG: protein phosphatase [Pirellulaceae bacterium]
MRRAINQDAYVVVLADSQQRWERRGHLFVVADGMGAHAAGELASKLAVQQVPLHYDKQIDLPPAEALRRAIQEANAEIHRRGQANLEFRNMGTTCTALALLPEGAVVGHVGDSRCYQLRGKRLYQLTFDHSLVWEMQAAGDVTDETARSGVIPKNVITRSLGPNATVEVDLEGPFPVQVGDRFLLCSDGLSGQVSDEEMGALLRSLAPQQAAKFLVDLANLRGGPDNITCVIVEVVDHRIETRAGASGGGPLTLPTGRFSPLLLITTLICWAAAGLLFLLGSVPLAIVAAVLGAISLLTALIRLGANHGGHVASSRYGNGPYRHYPAVADRELFEHLAGTLKSLREAVEERGWKVHWEELDLRFAEGCAAADRGNYQLAVGRLAQVISDLMDQIRKQREATDPADSSIEL